MLLNMPVSDSMFDYIKNYGTEYIKDVKSFKRIAHKLINLRNEILTLMLSREKYYEKTNMAEMVERADFMMISEGVRRLDGSPFLSPSYLWELPKRDSTKEEYKGDELSE